ncbi:MAG: hypothetical protein MUC34_15485 [Anaerolineae bacterium]|jgi:hypothetical protein|nr:hypothetical protein [Anaerolineae bacterium]
MVPQVRAGAVSEGALALAVNQEVDGRVAQGECGAETRSRPQPYVEDCGLMTFTFGNG